MSLPISGTEGVQKHWAGLLHKGMPFCNDGLTDVRSPSAQLTQCELHRLACLVRIEGGARVLTRPSGWHTTQPHAPTCAYVTGDRSA